MSVTADRDDDLVYTEHISSTRTEALFLALTGLFAWLSVRRVKAKRRDLLSTVFRCFCAVFLFYHHPPHAGGPEAEIRHLHVGCAARQHRGMPA